MFDPDTMRARFRELTAKRSEIMAVSAPLRAKRDEASAAYEAVARPLESQVREIEAPLYGIEQERAVIARALSGKTGAA
jgi:hypothetical protein